MYGVLLLETVRTALDSADLYWQFVSGYGDIKRLTSARISSISGPILGSVISLWVQLFFVYRIWILGKKESWWLCIPICLVTLPLVWFLGLFHNSPSSLLLTRQRRSWVVPMSAPSFLQDMKHGSHTAGACPRASPPWTNAESPRNGEVTIYSNDGHFSNEMTLFLRPGSSAIRPLTCLLWSQCFIT